MNVVGTCRCTSRKLLSLHATDIVEKTGINLVMLFVGFLGFHSNSIKGLDLFDPAHLRLMVCFQRAMVDFAKTLSAQVASDEFQQDVRNETLSRVAKRSASSRDSCSSVTHRVGHIVSYLCDGFHDGCSR